MKAAVYTRTGAAREVLEIIEEVKPTPSKNEILIALRASGINPGKVKRRASWNNFSMCNPKIIL